MFEQLIQRAKVMRRQPTDAEAMLWRHLRAGRMLGRKFKRQQPLGPYIVDFVCFESGLIIEADGGQHNVQEARDAKRTQWLTSQGYLLLRFWNNDVLVQTDAVMEAIRLAVEHPSPPTPLPQGERGDKADASPTA